MAEEEEQELPEPAITQRSRSVLVEAKIGYFYPTDAKFRHIYSNGGGIYGFEVSCQAWKEFYGWASGSYFTQTGRSQGEHHRTRITLVPLAAGLKYVIPFCEKRLDLYGDIGFVTTYFHTHDHSRYVIKSNSKWGTGGVWRIGCLGYVYDSLFIDVFADYTYTKIHFHNTDNGRVIRRTADISGFSWGAGIGYRF
jgi:hypothetical protein